MKIGDRVFVHGYIDEIRRDTVIVRNKGGYFGTDPGEVIVAYNSAHPNWIPVSERLPEEYDDYICSYGAESGHFVGVGTYRPEIGEWGFWTSDDPECEDEEHWLTVSNVVAWMPLPEPWKGENRQNEFANMSDL